MMEPNYWWRHLLVLGLLTMCYAVNIPRPPLPPTTSTTPSPDPWDGIQQQDNDSGSPTGSRRNCSSVSRKSGPDHPAEVSIKLLPGAAVRSGHPGMRYLPPPRPDSTPPDDGCLGDDDAQGTIAEETGAPDRWKVHVIMACTVAAAVEIVLVIFIILYWRQIRWTLRKINCPCDTCRTGSHHAMERDTAEEHDSGESDYSDELVVTFESAGIEPVRTAGSLIGQRSRDDHVATAAGVAGEEDSQSGESDPLAQPVAGTSAQAAVVHKYRPPPPGWLTSAVDSDDEGYDVIKDGGDWSDEEGETSNRPRRAEYSALPHEDWGLASPTRPPADDVTVTSPTAASGAETAADGSEAAVTSPQRRRGKTRCLHKGKKSVCEECVHWYGGHQGADFRFSAAADSQSQREIPGDCESDGRQSPPRATSGETCVVELHPAKDDVTDIGHDGGEPACQRKLSGVDFPNCVANGNNDDQQAITNYTLPRDEIPAGKSHSQGRPASKGLARGQVDVVDLTGSPGEQEYFVEIHQPMNSAVHPGKDASDP